MRDPGETARGARHFRGGIFCAAWAVALLCGGPADRASAQWMGKQTGCYAKEIAATPNRPTVSNTARVTQYGVLELEYGWDRMWPEKDVRDTSAGGMLKFGMLCDVELHWVTTSFESHSDSTGTYRTFGDNWLGTQVRFHRQVKVLPSMALAYGIKIPSATTKAGIGSGYVDHMLTFGASEDARDFTVDFNLTGLLAGRPGGGYDRNQELSLAVSHPIWRSLGFAGEVYGDTELNKDTPAFASSLYALTYTVMPRLVLDGGFETGLTGGGPHRHAFFGVTWSITNLYQQLRRK
jgi:hypothetical protein